MIVLEIVGFIVGVFAAFCLAVLLLLALIVAAIRIIEKPASWIMRWID